MRRGRLTVTKNDDSWRREAAAFGIIRILQREQPQDFEGFRARVLAESDDDRRVGIVAEWCDQRHLSSGWIKMAALHLALDPNDQPVGVLQVVIWIDDDGQPRDANWVPWRAGDSERAYLARAQAQFHRMPRHGISAPEFSKLKLEQLVRFQVNGESVTKIAGSNDRRSDLKRVLRDVAALLELKLRKAPPGRPRGSGRPQRRVHRFPRR
jgi:hypothetical protein